MTMQEMVDKLSVDIKMEFEVERLDPLFENKEAYEVLAGASEVVVSDRMNEDEKDAVSVVIPEAVLYLPMEDLVDFAKEKERLTKEKKRLEGELKRSNSMLSNEKFLSKAPAEKIDEEKEKQKKYSQMMKDVEERLKVMEK